MFRDSGNSDRVSGHIVDTKDVMDKTERKINILKEHKSQLLDDVQSNNIAGEMFVALVREVATEDEVEKVLLHIAEVGSVTHLLVLLTRRLARVEDEKEKIDSKEGKASVSVICFLAYLIVETVVPERRETA